MRNSANVCDDLRVVHIVPSLGAAKGGPSSSIVTLAAAQRALGAHVTIVTGAAGGQPEVFAANDVRVRSSRLLPLRGEIPGPHMLRLLAEEVAAANVVHLHSTWNAVISAAAAICLAKAKPFVLTPHGMMARKHVAGNWKKSAYWQILDRRTVSKAHAFHFLDDSEVLDTNWLPIADDAKVVVLPNGLDVAAVKNAATDSAPDPGPPFPRSGAVNLMFLGRLHVIKGIDLQIDVIRCLHSRGIDVHLHVVGPDEGDEARLRSYAHDQDLSENVHFHGPLYGPARFRWLREADAVLLSSHSECNSTSAAETFASGGALIATHSCNVDRAARAGATHSVPRLAEPIAQAVMEILCSDPAANLLRANAEKFAREQLCSTRIASKMLSLYRELQ